MSSTLDLFDLPEHICYVQCGFCSTILLVGVPRGSMSVVVTVRCGHCSGLLSVNMMKASFLPLHLLPYCINNESPEDQVSSEQTATGDELVGDSSSIFVNSSDNEEHLQQISVNHIVHKPPEKRQRAPSAYNRFIKEEIRRLKVKYPNMAHKEAFSTAAKNWANHPPLKEGDGESCVQVEERATWSSSSSDATQVENCRRQLFP